jgi:hypothetical protein
MNADKEVALRRAWGRVEQRERDKIRKYPERIIVPDGSRGLMCYDIASTVWTPLVRFERIEVLRFVRPLYGFVCDDVILDVELGLPEELGRLISDEDRDRRPMRRPFR